MDLVAHRTSSIFSPMSFSELITPKHLQRPGSPCLS